MKEQQSFRPFSCTSNSKKDLHLLSKCFNAERKLSH